MTVDFLDCDCQILYGVREVHVRALTAAGVPKTTDWYATDCPVDVGLDPEIEAGVQSNLKCGDGIKNTIKGDDQLTGMTVTLSLGCRNPEFEFIVGGSVGGVSYDASSPPCAIGYCPPMLDEQTNAQPFEMRIYRAEYSGSNVVGYEEIWLYQCLPAFPTIGGKQEDYGTVEWKISAVENPAYTPAEKPVYCWRILTSIPTS